MHDPQPAEPDALIFDMDGTLWDGVETYAQGFNDFFESHGISRRLKKSDIAGYMGWEQERYLAATIPEFLPEQRAAIYEEVIELQYERIRRDGGKLYVGVLEGLKQLAERYRLFIVSNCPRYTIDCFMDWTGIRPLITDTRAHGANFLPKFENIRSLIAQYELRSPVYVGDTDSDSVQSTLVPIPFVFVDYGFGHSEQYDIRFSSFPDLVKYYLPE